MPKQTLKNTYSSMHTYGRDTKAYSVKKYDVNPCVLLHYFKVMPCYSESTKYSYKNTHSTLLHLMVVNAASFKILDIRQN
jgi:hypothetical protein